MVRDLNRLYRSHPALYRHEFDGSGFEWIDCHDHQHSILSFLRKGDNGEIAIAVINLTPVPRHNYRVGVQLPGFYREAFNSDLECYGGSNMGNGSALLQTDELNWMNRPHSLLLTIPPLAGIVLAYEGCG